MRALVSINSKQKETKIAPKQACKKSEYTIYRRCWLDKLRRNSKYANWTVQAKQKFLEEKMKEFHAGNQCKSLNSDSKIGSKLLISERPVHEISTLGVLSYNQVMTIIDKMTLGDKRDEVIERYLVNLGLLARS
jgi:hypothetical protein